MACISYISVFELVINLRPPIHYTPCVISTKCSSTPERVERSPATKKVDEIQNPLQSPSLPQFEPRNPCASVPYTTVNLIAANTFALIRPGMSAVICRLECW